MVFHNNNSLFCEISLSLPLRERGLKSDPVLLLVYTKNVAPFAGAWIEIGKYAFWAGSGALSLPLRERGLKLVDARQWLSDEVVAPFAGAWIEIEQEITALMEHPSLPLRERGLKYQ